MFDIGPNLSIVIIAIASIWGTVLCVESICYRKNDKDDDDDYV